MTREETKDAIRVMQAFADGKRIEFYDMDSKCWASMDNYPPVWDWFNTKYRIAHDQEEPKEKHYRPYTMEEFVKDMHKHDGFVNTRDDNVYGYFVCYVGRSEILVNGAFIQYTTLLEKGYVWSDDGTPCGKEVTE